MFCERKANYRTNHLHERALRIVYKNRDLSFDDLLKYLFYDTPEEPLDIINRDFKRKK